MEFKDLFIKREEPEEEEIDLDALAAGLGEVTEESQVEAAEEESQVEVAEVDTNSADTSFADAFVEGTYLANDLDDLSNSIFKVEELSNTLPKEMPTDTKRATVTSIMQTVGLSIEDAVNDGETRVKVLNATLEKVTNQMTSANSSAEERIENLKKQIAEDEALIAKNKELIKLINENASIEVERINGLTKFIKGE